MPQAYSSWGEVLFLVIMFVGLVFGAIAPNAFITYLVAFVSGMLCGRWYHERRYKGRMPYTLIMAGFALGYIIGAFRGSRILTVIFFLGGAILMYKMIQKGWLKDVLY